MTHNQYFLECWKMILLKRRLQQGKREFYFMLQEDKKDGNMWEKITKKVKTATFSILSRVCKL